MGVKEARADGAFAHFQNGGNLGVGHALDVEHRHDGAVVGRELHHGLVDFPLHLAEVAVARWRALRDQLGELFVVGDAVIHIVEAHGLATPAFVDEIDGRIGGDAVQPSGELALPPEARDTPVNLHPHVLD